MTIAELLPLDFDVEVSNTRRALERIPENLPGYAPHPRSMGELAMHCSTILLFGSYISEDDGMDLAVSKRP